MKKLGYEIIELNYRIKFGEIDIISLKNKYLIFIEVKTRRCEKFGKPQFSVNYSKQNQIKKIAKFFIYEYQQFTKYKIRFDVIVINIKNNKAYLKHFDNAF